MRVRHGLFSKLLVSYVAVSFIPVVLIGLFTYAASASVLRSHILQSSRVALGQTGRNMDFVLDQALAAISVTMMDAEIERSLATAFPTGYERVKAIEQVESSLTQYTSALLSAPLRIILVGDNGITATNDQRITTLTKGNLQDLPWITDVRPDDKRVSWIGVHPSYMLGRPESLVFSAAKVLTNPYSGKRYGMLVLEIDLSTFQGMLPDALSPGTSIVLSDERGRVLAATDRNLVGRAEGRISEASGQLQDTVRVERTGRDAGVLLVHRLMRGGLVLSEQIPMVVFEREIYVLRDRVLAVLVAVLFASIAYAYFVARKISSPLVRLRNRIAEVARPQAFDRAADSPDEIGAIFTGYEGLVHKLEATVHDLVREQAEKRKAEIHALQMQINPHFLFNTLKAIKCLVWTDRQHLIEPTVNSLIRLLQQSLRNTDEMELLSDQIAQIEEFIRIQEVRLAHAIDFSVQLPDAARLCYLPKLILQPLVENAIVHGIETKIEHGRIWLNGTMDDGTLAIEVIDNGLGCDDARVREVMDGAPSGDQSDAHHIGLRNVDARLRAAFGDRYRMKLQSRYQAGTSVVLRFPAVREAKPL